MPDLVNACGNKSAMISSNFLIALSLVQPANLDHVEHEIKGDTTTFSSRGERGDLSLSLSVHGLCLLGHKTSLRTHK